MTEEIEAHILKKYEILQKLGKSILSNTMSSSFHESLIIVLKQSY